jgi:hypothetical protein
MEGGRNELCLLCAHIPSLLCVESNMYLNPYYVARVYYDYLETNVTFVCRYQKVTFLTFFCYVVLMKLQMFAKMPWCYWVTLPKYSSLHSISWIIHLTLLKRLLQDFSQVTLYHYVHWNNVWGALMR